MPTPDELDTSRPFRRGDALDSGVAASTFRGQRFNRVFRGIYVDSRVRMTPQLRVQAAVLAAGASSFASHVSAARWYGVPIPTVPDEHVTVPTAGDRGQRNGIVHHVSRADRVVEVRGLRVSTPGRMFVELGDMLSLVDLVVVGDHLVRTGLVRVEQLIEVAAASDLPGAALARRAAAYVREGVDSVMETRLRMLIVLAGLPEPRVNLTLRTWDGDPYRKYDLSYPEVRVIVEYDGRHHIEREAHWEDDLARREAIDDDGWRILVVVASGIFKDPQQTVDRVWRLLRKRQHPEVPKRPDDRWRAHFPGWC